MAATRLVDLSHAEAVARIGPGTVVLQPVGAVEQHGPHLPLGTDLFVAQALADGVAEERPDLDLVLLPPLAYSKSDEHAWSGGTVWLSAQTLLAVLDDLGRSLAKLDSPRLAFLNGHGGTSALLQVACRDIRRQYGLRTFLLHGSTPPDQGGPSPADELGMGIHGGTDETSIMLHLRPDLVDMDRAVRSVPEPLAEYRHVGFGRRVSFGWLSDDFGTGGVIGDPTTATADRGKQLYESAVSFLGEALAEVARFTPG